MELNLTPIPYTLQVMYHQVSSHRVLAIMHCHTSRPCIPALRNEHPAIFSTRSGYCYIIGCRHLMLCLTRTGTAQQTSWNTQLRGFCMGRLRANAWFTLPSRCSRMNVLVIKVRPDLFLIHSCHASSCVCCFHTEMLMRFSGKR